MTEQHKNQQSVPSSSRAGAGAGHHGSKRSKEFLIGIVAALCFIAAGAGLIRYFVARHLPMANSVAEDADAGLIDWQQVIEAHPDYPQFKRLQQECRALELQTQDVSDLFQVSPPASDSKPFEAAVWQKNAHDVIGGRLDLESRANKIRADYTAATEAEFQARSKAVDEEYLNAILNLNIRLDNQAAMHNPFDSKQEIADEQAVWQQQRRQLQQERGQRQRELYHRRQQDIAAHVESVLGPELAKWRANLPQTRAQQEADAVQKQSDADARNTDLIARQMETARNVQQRLGLRQQLADKRASLAALEAHILNDVAGKAAKIAILHHFTLILVDHPRVLSSFDPNIEAVDPLRAKASIAVGIKTMDVTAELVQEMETLSDQTDDPS